MIKILTMLETGYMRSWAIAILLLFSAQALAQATVVVRDGEYITQYAISDPGNASGFDNNRVFVSHRIPEVVIQVSGVNFHTSSESYHCWQDTDEVECPDDDIGGGALRSPTLVFLDSILEAQATTQGAPLSNLAEKKIYLAFWHEYRTKKIIRDSVAEMELEGLNSPQKRRSLKFVYYGNGIDFVTAEALANDRINNGTIATYNDYNLTTMPLQDRRLLKLFGEVGWFDE